MISAIPKVDYGFTFEPSTGSNKGYQQGAEEYLDAMMRRKQYEAQIAAKTSNDIEQKFGQLHQLTNQEIDGMWADKFQEMFSGEFTSLTEMAQKNDPSFWVNRQKVAQRIVDFKNQIKQAQGVREQIKTVLDSDPGYSHLNKNQFMEYLVRKNFYQTLQNPDGTVGAQVLKNPGDIKVLTPDEIKAEATSMSNPFINKDFVLNNVVKVTPFTSKTDVDETLLSKDKKLRTTIESELPEYASYSSKSGFVIDPTKLEAYYKDKRGQLPGLDAYLNSIGNDYKKFASDLMLNPEFTKSIKAKVGNAEVMRFESQTTINNNNNQGSGMLYRNPDLVIQDINSNPTKFGKNISSNANPLYDVTQKFGGFLTEYSPEAGNPILKKKGQFKQVIYDPGGYNGIQPYYKVTLPDGSSMSMQPDQFSMYLNDLSPSASYSKSQTGGSNNTTSGGKKTP